MGAVLVRVDTMLAILSWHFGKWCMDSKSSYQEITWFLVTVSSLVEVHAPNRSLLAKQCIVWRFQSRSTGLITSQIYVHIAHTSVLAKHCVVWSLRNLFIGQKYVYIHVYTGNISPLAVNKSLLNASGNPFCHGTRGGYSHFWDGAIYNMYISATTHICVSTF